MAADRRTDLAVTAPVLSVRPRAIAHWPTVRAEELAVSVLVTEVFEVSVTVVGVVLAAGLALGAEPAPRSWPERSTAATVRVSPSPDTAVTSPVSIRPNERIPEAKLPDGRAPDVVAPPDGIDPPRARDGRLPENSRGCRSNPPIASSHFPPVAAVTATLEAVTGSDAVAVGDKEMDEAELEPPDPLVADRTLTQSPTLMLEIVPGTCWLNVVDEVYVTAVCSPLPCTWKVLPSISATSPKAP